MLLLLGRIKAAAGDVSVHQTVEQMIRSYVSRQSENPLTAMAVKVGEMTGVINYKDITDSLLDQTARTINEWEDSMHPMHEKLKTMLYDFAGQMSDDPDIGKEIQRIADGVRRGGRLTESAEMQSAVSAACCWTRYPKEKTGWTASTGTGSIIYADWQKIL